MDKKILFLSLVVFCAPLHAQSFPEAPSTHRYWDTTNQSLIMTHVALETIDSAITHRNLGRGGKEMNNMAKSLCESGTPGQIVYFAGRSVGVVGISYLLHKMGRHKIERIFIVAASVDSAYGVTYSFAHR